MLKNLTILLSTTLLMISAAACKKDESGAKPGEAKPVAGAKEERPAPFEVSINKVEQKTQVAPNKTYEDRGLGKKPAAGMVFVCVQYSATNKGTAEEQLPVPKLVDAKGQEHDLSVAAAGSYMPKEWPVTPRGKAAPGATMKLADCFEVAPDAATGMKLGFVDTGWGPKFKPWKTSVSL